MELFMRDMTEELARLILGWTYEKPYELYNNELTNEAMSEILNNAYFAVVDEAEELVGFFLYWRIGTGSDRLPVWCL